MAVKLLAAMLLVTYICEGALLEKSTAYDFLQKTRERRGLECFPGGCSTEVSEPGEVMEVNVGNEESSILLYNGATAKKEINNKPETHAREAVVDEGSGM